MVAIVLEWKNMCPLIESSRDREAIASPSSVVPGGEIELLDPRALTYSWSSQARFSGSS